MESSIAVFLLRHLAPEQLPTPALFPDLTLGRRSAQLPHMHLVCVVVKSSDSSTAASELNAGRNDVKKLVTLLDLCVSSLRRGHANLLCIVPILTDDPRKVSDLTWSSHREGGDRRSLLDLVQNVLS